MSQISAIKLDMKEIIGYKDNVHRESFIKKRNLLAASMGCWSAVKDYRPTTRELK